MVERRQQVNIDEVMTIVGMLIEKRITLSSSFFSIRVVVL
jgi:hypothetical protein